MSGILFDTGRYDRFDRLCEVLVMSSLHDGLEVDELPWVDDDLFERAYRHFQGITLCPVKGFVGYFGSRVEDMAIDVCMVLSEALDVINSKEVCCGEV